jgi:hypothetical protein
MKRILVALTLCSAIPTQSLAESCSLYKNCDYQSCHNLTSRSFLFIRPVYEHVVIRNHLWDSIIYSKKGTIRGSTQGIALYQHSRDPHLKDKEFAKYFLINNKSTLLVSGDDNVGDTFTRDVRAEWLGLPDNFRGFLTMTPEQWQAGMFLEYNQDLGALWPTPFLSHSHLSMSVPFVHAENNLHLSQSHIENPGTTPGMPTDILAAFKQPNWRNCKIDGKTEISRFPEVRIQFWRTFMDCDDMQLNYYSGLIIPTNIKPNPTFLFNATAGNGGHVGINAGVVMQVQVLDRGTCGRLDWFLDLDATYRFHNHQWRTFDLKHRPWSRFLLFATHDNPGGINIPGVDILTVPCKVRAYGLFDFVTGLRYRTDWGSLECSYNAWGHSKEHVSPSCQLIFNQGIMGNFSVGDLPESAAESTIATQAPNDPVFVCIRKSDLDIHSAATGNAFTQSINVAGGIEHSFHGIQFFAGLGCFAEWSRHNHPLNSWGAWGKLGASF